MMGIDVHRYCVNGKEVDLVRLAAIFKVIPIFGFFTSSDNFFLAIIIIFIYYMKKNKKSFKIILK